MESSRPAGSGERLHPARGLQPHRQARHALVARQGQQRPALAGQQGVLRPRAVPGDARRHREEVPGDVRLPRPLREGVGPQPDRRAVPAGRGDRPDPAAGRALGRAQDAGPARTPSPSTASTASSPASAATRRRCAPRSACSARAARRRMGLQGPAAGVLGPVQDRLPGRARMSASIRCCTGPSSTSGATSSARASRWSSSTSPRTASATARSATRTSPSRSTATPPRSTRSSPSWRRPGRRSARAGPWTTRPRTLRAAARAGYM